MCSNLLLTIVVVGARALTSPTAKDIGLEGDWLLESKFIVGKPEPLSRQTFVHIFGVDGKCLRSTGGDPATFHYYYTIDTTVRPMRIDKTSKPLGTAKPVLGIFKIEGDTLTICQATTPDGDRPTTFESTKDPPTWLYVYKRVKKKD
jgi:uncharacterized protein (TIGR03067 family)